MGISNQRLMLLRQFLLPRQGQRAVATGGAKRNPWCRCPPEVPPRMGRRTVTNRPSLTMNYGASFAENPSFLA